MQGVGRGQVLRGFLTCTGRGCHNTACLLMFPYRWCSHIVCAVCCSSCRLRLCGAGTLLSVKHARSVAPLLDGCALHAFSDGLFDGCWAGFGVEFSQHVLVGVCSSVLKFGGKTARLPGCDSAKTKMPVPCVCWCDVSHPARSGRTACRTACGTLLLPGVDCPAVAGVGQEWVFGVW